MCSSDLYVGPSDANEDRERRSGEAGAGLQLIQRGPAIVVAAAVSDGPGARAGIRPGDTIVSVDGQQVQGKDARLVASWIDGPEQTTVLVTWRAHDGRQHLAELVRAMVPPETVYSQRSDNVLVIQITAFNRSTAAHLAAAIQDFTPAKRCCKEECATDIHELISPLAGYDSTICAITRLLS